MAPLLTLHVPVITLRDYQEDAIARVLDAWTLPARRALVVLPTGCHRAGRALAGFFLQGLFSHRNGRNLHPTRFQQHYAASRKES